MEGDSEVNKKESKKFLKKSGYENDQEEVEHVENNLEFSEVIFSSNADSFSENKKFFKKKSQQRAKKKSFHSQILYQFRNTNSWRDLGL